MTYVESKVISLSLTSCFPWSIKGWPAMRRTMWPCIECTMEKRRHDLKVWSNVFLWVGLRFTLETCRLFFSLVAKNVIDWETRWCATCVRSRLHYTSITALKISWAQAACWFPKTNKSIRVTKHWQAPVNDLNTDRYHAPEPVISFWRISLANWLIKLNHS